MLTLRPRPFNLDRDTNRTGKKGGERFEFRTPADGNVDHAIGAARVGEEPQMCSSNGTRKSERMLTINTPNNARPRMMSIVRTRSLELAGCQSDSGGIIPFQRGSLWRRRILRPWVGHSGVIHVNHDVRHSGHRIAHE